MSLHHRGWGGIISPARESTMRVNTIESKSLRDESKSPFLHFGIKASVAGIFSVHTIDLLFLTVSVDGASVLRCFIPTHNCSIALFSCGCGHVTQ